MSLYFHTLYELLAFIVCIKEHLTKVLPLGLVLFHLALEGFIYVSLLVCPSSSWFLGGYFYIMKRPS